MSQTKRVAVIGAGIVGLSVALWLQRAGVRDVILIDKAPPGGGASFGNAGVMADYARVPFANWAQFKQLPRALLDRSSPVAVRRHYLPPMLRYAAGFARACTPSRFHAGCRALVALQRTAVQDTTTLLQHAGATSLVRDSGVLALSSSRAGLQQALAGHVGLRERLGARAARLSAADDIALTRPVAWLERSVYLTPMLGGIRVAGVAEFAQPDHPASDELFALLEADAATMLGRRPTVTSRWVGARPSTPDSLPIVGRVPSCKAVSLALGHGHLGLTFAAVTARLVAESVVRGDDTAEMAPFLPARFA
ncbi:NAD(P)/FAD-dependent oxidoreductase [Bordetella genomosp. 7]|uniref:NAD(P)/FAD-dependent oxidoreductase n=1 Tax=Bordetella genomosp. 7 TaxID=1416805 RepID=UPI0014838BF4|nr:FAD-dependent oxidoreductase [Bordetella genomosp. 7]